MSLEGKLLLFDIDGTLVDTEGAGLESLEDGLHNAFPDRVDRPFPELELGGATDGSVASFLFEHYEIEDTPERRSLFFERYAVALRGRLSRFRAAGKGRALPGVADLLRELRGGGSVETGLLTGNIEVGARIKLEHFALNDHFAFGAFGDDHHDRDELGPIALRRAREATGQSYRADSVAIIGDTPRDVACARACGARVVAVATGAASRHDLEATGPDALLDDLADPARTVAALEDVFSA